MKRLLYIIFLLTFFNVCFSQERTITYNATTRQTSPSDLNGNFSKLKVTNLAKGALYVDKYGNVTNKFPSIFSDTWTPISDDTNTLSWWRSYYGITKDSSSNVTEVLDSSGFGRALYQGTATKYPFYLTNGLGGGKASLVFDGSNDYLQSAVFNSEQPLTTYFLFKAKGWTSLDRIFTGVQASSGAASNAYIYQSASSPYFFHRTGGAVGNGINKLDLNTWGTITAVWSNTASKMTVNGLAEIGSALNDGGFGGFTIAASELGALCGNIEWGEMIVRAGIDNETNKLKIKRYLQKVAGKPFKMLVFDGDSITAGAGISEASTFSALVVTNFFPFDQDYFYKITAVGGDTTSNMIVRAETTDQWYHPNNDLNMLMAGGLSNEMFNQLSTNLVYSNYVYYCQQRRLAGWKVIAETVLPRSGGSPPSSFETDRTNINILIRSNYLQFADGLADVATNGFIGCPECSATNTYFSDGTHLTAAGHAIYAKIVTNAILRVLYDNAEFKQVKYNEQTLDMTPSSLNGVFNAIGVTGNIQFNPASSGPKVLSGSGSPESSITATIGSVYFRSDGGVGTSLYLKESGTGNTGWKEARASELEKLRLNTNVVNIVPDFTLNTNEFWILNSLETNITVWPTNLVDGKDMTIVFRANNNNYDITITNFNIIVYWPLDTATNGSTSLTVTNGQGVEINLKARTNGLWAVVSRFR